MFLWDGYELITTADAYERDTPDSLCIGGIFKIDFDYDIVTASITTSQGLLGCAPFENNFYSSGEDATSFMWDFGDGQRSIEENPFHEFEEPGIYEVMLIAENPTACNQRDTAYATINVFGGGGILDSTMVCSPFEPIVLSTPLNGDSYEWNTGYTGASLEATDLGSYWVDVYKDNCVTRDSFLILEQQSFNFDLGANIFECDIQSVILDAFDNEISTYMWSTGESTPSIEVNESGTYYISVSNVLGCQLADSIEVSLESNLFLSLGNDTTLCRGETLTLFPNIPNASYEWQDGSTAESYNVSESGSYSVKVKVNECEFESEILVSFNELTLDLGPDIWQCSEDPYLFDASNAIEHNSTIDNYLWSNGSNLPEIQVNESGIYSLLVTDTNACTVSDTIQISLNLNAAKMIFAGEDKVLLPNQAYTIPATLDELDNVILSWTPATNLSCYDCLNPIANPEFTTTYILTAIDTISNCQYSDDIVLFITARETEEYSVYTPNIINTNGDGLNKYFTLYTENNNDLILTLSIYDRWGNLVYQKNNVSTNLAHEGWDGTVNGDKGNPGVYVFLAEVMFSNNSQQVITGHITVIR